MNPQYNKTMFVIENDNQKARDRFCLALASARSSQNRCREILQRLRACKELTWTIERWIGMQCEARNVQCGKPHKRFATTQCAQRQRANCPG